MSVSVLRARAYDLALHAHIVDDVAVTITKRGHKELEGARTVVSWVWSVDSEEGGQQSRTSLKPTHTDPHPDTSPGMHTRPPTWFQKVVPSIR